jgi:hypothetical protein
VTAAYQPNSYPNQQNQQLTRAEEAVVAAIAAYLATRRAVAAVRLPGALVGRLIALGLSQRAVREAGRMVMAPPLTGRTRWGSPAVPAPGAVVSAVRTVAADEPMMRARYLLNAAKRLTDAIVQGDFPAALKAERRYLDQHRAAGIGRRAGAAAVDAVAARSSGYLVWVGGTCPECKPLDGQVFRVGNMPLPPLHPHCLIGSSRISAASLVVPADVAQRLPADLSSFAPSPARHVGAPTTAAVAETERDFGRGNIRAVTVRDFVGDVVTILTASGKELTGTPNHPVATRSGWVALAELNVGMDVLGSTGPEWEPTSVNPDEDDVPPTIEQVAQTFPVTFDPMPTSPEDFHGDGASSDVHVVLTDGLLRYDVESLCPQHLDELQLSRRDIDPECGFADASTGLKLRSGGLAASDGVVGGGGHAGAFLGRRLPHPDVHGFTRSTGLDSSVGEHSIDGPTADSEGFCERIHALSSQIFTDQIVDVRRYPFSGHVYNLETVDGYYISNGILTHNCSCGVRSL